MGAQLEYGTPAWFACKTGLGLYLVKLDADERVFAGTALREVDATDREALVILRDHVAGQRRVVHSALVALEAMR